MREEEVLKAVKFSESNKIKFVVTDIDGVLRGKTITKSKFQKGLDENVGFCNVVFGWDMNDAVYDNSEVTGWHTGYPDAMATIDLGTFRKIPWNEEVPFFLADFSNSDNMSGVCPRTLLKNVREQALQLGYNPQFANEFEWFNFRETPQSLKDKNYTNPTPLTPGMFGYSVLRSSQNQEFFNDLYDLLHQFDVPIEAIHTETGDGVYEACIEYSDILEAADRAVLFKTGVKEIAYRHEILATFMAKWSTKFPGCGGHIHQSLWDEPQKNNLFYDDSARHKMSSLLEHYLAGQLHCLPYILPMYAPTVNSYKRFVEGSWASTTVSWGVENRTTALRVINHAPGGMRLETRVPGADANPYLTMAACLASGLYGIKNELSLHVEPTRGNEYDNETSLPLPTTLPEATAAMKSSDIPKELFGEAFTDHFIKTREWEQRQFARAVTDWELKRYFEII
ncbi:glutamine synthetase family protein [Aliifodinibius sp. S!AR15-10]|uniref:glutamine synthetase family protein n=1 Tax=Aliifodinibius sp. S!AR15-10 TaxID=2950437 RepID=UPI002859F2FE|nr:glutamine synthetase family protein [Aliifodinibius sp. S!AR15-10]MDR8393914.1 glutamine synthetase family protein [Aliifodinibius sp. S!AR15-10]